MTIRRLHRVLAGIFLCAASHTGSIFAITPGDSVPDVLTRSYERGNILPDFQRQWFADPALLSFRYAQSLSSIGIGYADRNEDAGVSAFTGEGYRGPQARAVTYLKHKSSTLTGFASYRNTKTRNQVWNETSDADIIYPYFTADSIGGNLQGDEYAIGGTFSDMHGKIIYGGGISYVATQNYRDVDPRPRNITGKFDLEAGVGLLLPRDYAASLSANFRKYNQSSRITFVSPTGKQKVYHLTGLGTHYARFAGAADNSNYNGIRFGGTLSLMPRHSNGGMATVSVRRFTLTKTLADLNNLDLAKIGETHIIAAAGWVGSTTAGMGNTLNWGAKATVDVNDRKGHENIFGDPANAVYPKIGTLDMYSDKLQEYFVSGFCEIDNRGSKRLGLCLEGGFSDRTTAYTLPVRKLHTADLCVRASLSGNIIIRRNWLVGATADCEFKSPVQKEWTVKNRASSEKSLMSRLDQMAKVLHHSSQQVGITVNVSRAINNRYALRLEAGWAHTAYGYSLTADDVNVALSFIF